MSNQLTPIQSGWLRLAEIKQNLFTDLQNAELAVQGKLQGIEGNTALKDVQASIKEAKDILSDAKGKRLAFTRMLDEKLLTPSMDFEKRILEQINQAAAHELNLRKEEEAKARDLQSVMQEEAAFKAHITNEWYRIAAEYRAMLDAVIVNSYKRFLNDSVHASEIESKYQSIADELATIQLPMPVKFNRIRIDDILAKELISEVRSYNKDADLESAIKSLPQRFSLYAHDLHNAAAAIEQMEIETKLKAEETAQKLASEQATNVLIAQAETVIIDTPKVKRELKIVVIESEQWAMTVMANFIKNWQYVNKYVRVKSWSKLTISQMADALAKHISETGEDITGLQTEEICK